MWNEKKAYAVAIEWWGFAEDASASIYPGVVSGHAGVEETAMVIAIAPDTIDAKRATTIRRAARRTGMRARPFPASIILDRPESGAEGAPILDPAKAKAFYSAVLTEIEKALGQLFAGWSDIGR